MCLLKIAAGLFLAISCSSCASFLHDPKDASQVKNCDSIIFGKDEITFNNKPMDYRGRELFVKKMIIHHISPFVSLDAINRNPWLPGKYAYKVTDDDDGYFAFAAPAGKYYYVELDYIYILSEFPSFGLRSYMKIGGIMGHEVPHPFIMTFDVPTNSAVYIGTMKQDFHQLTTNWLTADKYHIMISVTNDFPAAKKWFLDSNKDNGKNIVEQIVDINNITNN
jgi:hypothetical protein